MPVGGRRAHSLHRGLGASWKAGREGLEFGRRQGISGRGGNAKELLLKLLLLKTLLIA